jgi:putative AlgH/UPF0301 family transcriptional regulator
LKTEEQPSRRFESFSWLWPAKVFITLVIILAVLVTGATRPSAEPPAANAKSFFLVASRDMPDPVFQQSVILMLPSEEPPLVAGVIINKPTDVRLGNLIRQPLALQNRNRRVYFGGPVELSTPLLLIRTSKPPKAATRLWGNVYAVDDPSSISDLLKDSRSTDDARLFLGRAQWLQEQLRGELLEGAWSVVPPRADLIFEHDSAKIWPLLSRHQHVREIEARGVAATGVEPSALCTRAFTW